MVLYISVKYERKMKDFGILQVLLQRLCQISKYQLYLHQTVRLAILYRVIIVPLYTIGHRPKTTVRAEQLLTSYNYEPGIYQINTITHATSRHLCWPAMTEIHINNTTIILTFANFIAAALTISAIYVQVTSTSRKRVEGLDLNLHKGRP